MGDASQAEDLRLRPEGESSFPPDLYTSVSGTRIRYWDIGTGNPPIVLVHGIGTFCETWLMNVRVLQQHYRIIALDLPGHGYSEHFSPPYDADHYARFLNDFLQTLGVDHFSLIGNSFGGTVALQTAYSFPEKIHRLILAAAAGFGREVSLGFRLIGLPLIGKILLRPKKKEESRRKRSEAILSSIMHDPEVLSPEIRNRLLEKYAEAAGAPDSGRAIHAVLGTYTNLFGIKNRYMAESREKLTAVTAPALIIWGEDDPILPVAQAYAGRSLLRNAKLSILEHCGHLPQLEHGSLFNELVLDFLKG
jgi:4,5:9,10-diseco-3-hydroxy-5,9,17-trioxoandrosta-1(10),2-diene-4-oate hydrolase